MHNLWSILPRQTLVSGRTYEALCFFVEFFVALFVFTLTEYFINEYRSRRESCETAGLKTNIHDGAE